MLTHELLNELHKLNRADKLRVVQLLVNELADGQTSLLKEGVEYEIWSPYDAYEAADTLLKLLQGDKDKNA
jgi:hypothetical protein